MNARLQALPKRREWLSVAILFLLIIAIFAPIIGAQVGGEDFGGHEILVRQMEAAGKITLPHFLYHLLMIGMDRLFPEFGLSRDSLILLVLFELLLGSILFWIFNRELGRTSYENQSGAKQAIGRIFLILALMIVAPILPLALITGKLHPGDWNFLAITNYFNPTMILVRPLALLLFYFALSAFRELRPSNRIVVLSAILAMLATLAKPNFSICLLPALGIAAAAMIQRRQQIHWKELLFGLVIPLVAVLAWQFWFTYSHTSPSLTESHIIIAPFAMFPWNWIAARYLLSILFPLVVLLAFWRRSIKDFPLLFAWLVFAIGSFFTYLVAESGQRLKDGNFVWCGEITLFVLFVLSVVSLIKWSREEDSRWKPRLAWTIFALHIASGVVWYIGHFTRIH